MNSNVPRRRRRQAQQPRPMQAVELVARACQVVAEHMHADVLVRSRHMVEDEPDEVARIAKSVIGTVHGWLNSVNTAPVAGRILHFIGDNTDAAALTLKTTVTIGEWNGGLVQRQDGTWAMRFECPLTIQQEPDRPTDRLVRP